MGRPAGGRKLADHASILRLCAVSNLAIFQSTQECPVFLGFGPFNAGLSDVDRPGPNVDTTQPHGMASIIA